MDCIGGGEVPEAALGVPEVRIATEGGPIKINSLDGIVELDSGGGAIQVGHRAIQVYY